MGAGNPNVSKKFDAQSLCIMANLFVKYAVADLERVWDRGTKPNLRRRRQNEIAKKAYTPVNSIFGRKIGKNFYVRLTMGNVFNKKYFEIIAR